MTSSSSHSVVTPPPQSQFSFVTESSLLLSQMSTTSSGQVSLTNPDAPTTTISVQPTAPQSLPTNLPSRIYPFGGATNNAVNSTVSLVSLLFDNDLSWSFVVNNQDSAGQLLSWTPFLITSALGLSQNQVQTYCLQVFIPSDYAGPQDASKLLTNWLGYMPNDMIDVLANELMVKASAFYTSAPMPYVELAQHVNTAYAIQLTQPNVIPGSGNINSGGSNGSGSNNSSSNTKKNVIIGVVASLGGVTVLILAVLVVRSYKKRQELAHRRLSDPNVPNDPYPERDGRDFDQDTVGGQRRRSYYFAEDSLRGYQEVPQAGPSTLQVNAAHTFMSSPEQMRERRPVAPAVISAPVLQQSSLNW